jgi:hypothetical protein
MAHSGLPLLLIAALPSAFRNRFPNPVETYHGLAGKQTEAVRNEPVFPCGAAKKLDKRMRCSYKNGVKKPVSEIGFLISAGGE